MPVALLVLSVLLLFGLIGLGGTRVLARRRTPPAPQPGEEPATVAFDPVEAELQAMLEEEGARTAAREAREPVPL